MFIVAGQTPIASKPPEAALGDPAPWQYFKALGARFALNDLQRPAKVLTGVVDNGFVGPIGPDQLEPAPAVVETLLVAVEERLQSQLAALGILHTGAVHDHHTCTTVRCVSARNPGYRPQYAVCGRWFVCARPHRAPH